MDEYQDQAVWFEVQIQTGARRWVSMTDEAGHVLTGTTREIAEKEARKVIVREDIVWRVVRRRGLA